MVPASLCIQVECYLLSSSLSIPLPLPLSSPPFSTDDVRHDVYLTILSGVFSKGTKRADKNVEVDIEVIDEKDNVIPVCCQRDGGGTGGGEAGPTPPPLLPFPPFCS